MRNDRWIKLDQPTSQGFNIDVVMPMAYCRYNSDPDPDEDYYDVYLYGDVGYNAIVCFECCMNDFNNVMFKKRSAAISHMEQHIVMGHEAPYDHVISRLRDEIDRKGDDVVFTIPPSIDLNNGSTKV